MMRFRYRVLASTVALFVLAATAFQAASAASADAQFRAAVARVLNNIRSGQQALADMSNAEFHAFVSCAQNVMDGAPRPDKEFVLAGRSLSEQRRRFDQVASKVPLDRGAPLKGQITQSCYN